MLHDASLAGTLRARRMGLVNELAAIDLLLETIGAKQPSAKTEAPTLRKVDARGSSMPVFRRCKGHRAPRGLFEEQLKGFMPNGGEKLTAPQIRKMATRAKVRIRNLHNGLNRGVQHGVLNTEGRGAGRVYWLA